MFNIFAYYDLKNIYANDPVKKKESAVLCSGTQLAQNLHKIQEARPCANS